MEGFFHADPHPGNLKVLADGRVILLDAGMVGLFDPRTWAEFDPCMNSHSVSEFWIMHA